jgi:hypothetical protein
MAADFAGIEEKLKRADENILNLQAEVSLFFQKCKYPVMPKINNKEHGKAVQYFKKLTIPLRFSVLSGEIIHHLRSCLDHIVWEFSEEAYRTGPNFRYIEFPILDTRPPVKDEFTRYGRKIKGVTNAAALKLIRELQPYKRTYPAADPLFIINAMDITDKHRELVITRPSGYMEAPGYLMNQVSGHLLRKTRMSAELERQLDQYGKITPQISFKDFSRGIVEPIGPRLTQLTNDIRDVVSQFARLVT